MYDFRDEAVHALTYNSVSRVKDDVDLQSWDFNLIVATQSTIVTYVEFKKDADCKNEVTSAFPQDIAALTSLLAVNSRVLLDFTGLKTFSLAFIDTLMEFNTELKHRGSRLVLCCLEPAVRDSFFVTPRPCSH
jgi:hypothetical protein